MIAHAQHHTPGLWCSCCSVIKVDLRSQRIPATDPRVRATITEVCEKTSVTYRELFSRRRHHRIAVTRAQIATELRTLGFSYSDIGRILWRDHSSVMAMVRKVQATASEAGL